MKKPLSRICECGICGAVEITKQSTLPEGWAILWEPAYTMCNSCLDRWNNNWGEPPVWEYGPEKELMLI